MAHLQDIIKANTPCKYYISAKNGIFLLGVHRKIFEYAAKQIRDPDEQKYIERLSDMLRIGNFVISDRAFGFGEVFKTMSDTDDFLQFMVKENSSVTQIVASLAIFSSIMDECRIQTDSSFSQLINFRIHIRDSSGAYGMIMTGEISKIVTEWLRSLGEQLSLKEISKSAENCALNTLGYNLDHIKIEARNGKFYTSRNNPDCGLHPFYPEDMDKARLGQEFGGHNVDQPYTIMESLIILAGLCDVYSDHNKTTP